MGMSFGSSGALTKAGDPGTFGFCYFLGLLVFTTALTGRFFGKDWAFPCFLDGFFVEYTSCIIAFLSVCSWTDVGGCALRFSLLSGGFG